MEWPHCPGYYLRRYPAPGLMPQPDCEASVWDSLPCSWGKTPFSCSAACVANKSNRKSRTTFGPPAGSPPRPSKASPRLSGCVIPDSCRYLCFTDACQCSQGSATAACGLEVDLQGQAVYTSCSETGFLGGGGAISIAHRFLRFLLHLNFDFCNYVKRNLL